jgi:hypothetical protein
MYITELLIKATNGRFFSIFYTNKKGEQNEYVVRTGVKKGLKGGTNNCPPDAVTLYAVMKNGKRESTGFKTMFVDKIVFKNKPKIKFNH